MGLCFLLGLSSACSLIIDFDPELKPCTEDGNCLDGYSCMVNQCVRDASLTEGQTCFRNRMCEANLRCSIPEFVCRRPCQTAFADTNACGAGSACLASRDSEELFIAVCRPSECSTELPCPLDKDGIATICVQVTATAGTCMYGCTISCLTGQACGDDCRGGDACHPISSTGTLVCLEPGLASGQGTSCDLASNRCEAGLACIPSSPEVSAGSCLTFCDEPSDCGVLSCNTAPSDDHSLCGPPP